VVGDNNLLPNIFIIFLSSYKHPGLQSSISCEPVKCLLFTPARQAKTLAGIKAG